MVWRCVHDAMAGTVLYDTMGVRSMTFTCDDCGTPVDAWDLDDYQDWTGEKFGCIGS